MKKQEIRYLTTLYSNMKKLFSSDYKLKDALKQDLYYKCIEYLDDDLKLEKIKSKLITFIENHPKLKKSPIKVDEYIRIISSWEYKIDVYLFAISLVLMLHKNQVVFEIKKLVEYSMDEIITDYHPLTLTYNSLTVAPIYMIRGITLSYIKDYISNLYSEDENFEMLYDKLVESKIDVLGPFDQIITESLKQSSLVSGGAKYEDSIYSYLTDTLGLDKEINSIKVFTHEDNNSLENDIEFMYKGLKFGISAKKSLRERYKQYVNTSGDGSSLDVMMTITLGTDLNKAKADTLVNQYGVYVFVSPEVYEERKYLHKFNKVYPIFDLTTDLLDEIVDNMDS